MKDYDENAEPSYIKYWDVNNLWVLLNRAPTSTQLHPAPLSSIHLHPIHFNLHSIPFTSTQLI